ncbi:MAG: hypothetical protein HY243_19330 [Proteobacteria bacterium]|nr:hypothetical protein [Pseudomonadota bacterium]
MTSIAMAQPGDEDLSCTVLKQQIADNRDAEAKFRHKDKEVENGNVAKNVASVIPVAGLVIVASTDLSNEEQVKARSLADRNERLENLAKQKGCTP